MAALVLLAGAAITALMVILVPCPAGAVRRFFFGISERRIMRDQFVSEWEAMERVILS